jgi:hypothetical protein
MKLLTRWPNYGAQRHVVTGGMPIPASGLLGRNCYSTDLVGGILGQSRDGPGRIKTVGRGRAEYGEHLIEALAERLTERFGEGYQSRNLW